MSGGQIFWVERWTRGAEPSWARSSPLLLVCPYMRDPVRQLVSGSLSGHLDGGMGFYQVGVWS